MTERVKIHFDQDAVKPITPEKPCITVCNMDGTILERGRKVHLRGEWTVRQYRNPVPCGASIVLYPSNDTATYHMERENLQCPTAILHPAS